MTFFTPGGRRIRVDPMAMARAAAPVIDGNNLNTNATKDAFIDTRTDAQIAAFMRTVLKGMFDVEPDGP